jgi:hypothetical protein
LSYRTIEVRNPNVTAPSFSPHYYPRVYTYMPISSSGCSGILDGYATLASLGMAGESCSFDDPAAALAVSRYQT